MCVCVRSSISARLRVRSEGKDEDDQVWSMRARVEVHISTANIAKTVMSNDAYSGYDFGPVRCSIMNNYCKTA